ncbi:hypothetical protein [Nocardia sp. NBC_00511]|uniref:hypothetical protein n=1 Tax=Nocardia sp. NBC_00511 TaxID=2903591 RepID=UPI0030DF68CB
MLLAKSGIPVRDDPTSVGDALSDVESLDRLYEDVMSGRKDPRDDSTRLGVIRSHPSSVETTNVLVTLIGRRRRELADVHLMLSGQEQLEKIRGAVELRVEDPAVRQELAGLVAEVATHQRNLAAQLADEMTRLFRHCGISSFADGGGKCGNHCSTANPPPS